MRNFGKVLGIRRKWCSRFYGNFKDLNELDSLFGLLSSGGCLLIWKEFVEVLGTIRPVGFADISSRMFLDADLWGILDGLVLLIDQGYDNMLIQTDSLEAVKAIQESPSNGSNYTLVRRIHPLLSWIGHWSVWHISR
ncbi:hypothetical protein Goklo_005066 [Gossypium klotzschianum]|uniref:RNase H type-1 domain-containing protein n=1 Tax=Gossypium klotzschianum TaxID=34286 RepID=A0A7J8VRU9_9ROSI|nr:hypothetical protein [Gossypium klotzschianum]